MSRWRSGLSAQVNGVNAHGVKVTREVTVTQCLEEAKECPFKVSSIAVYRYDMSHGKLVAIWYADDRRSYYGGSES